MSLDPQLVREICRAALPLSEPERESLLAERCKDNEELLRAVRDWLRASDPTRVSETLASEDGGCDELSPTLGATTISNQGTVAVSRNDSAPSAELVADRYQLQEKIGEGGMGEVWIADQVQPVKRKVALKLIKTGMNSQAVLQRFDQERQALAIMEHPNIARVLDAGLTSERQPFFVMELVDGLPLTNFCDQHRLSLQQRLELFVPICQAVQHAHQKGIVHRDLKPGNILVSLVDGKPVPKVIDFGVAKAVGDDMMDDVMQTQVGTIVGTLEYMSPEQAGDSNGDVDTRSDIYSLGVILYELLTGLRPIDAARLKNAGLMEMIRVVREEEPSKPSTRLSTNEALASLAATRRIEPTRLMALLRGDLDWVVMKCLEKDRDRRYETAASLGRDIQCYLADEPVEARPPDAVYRFRKLLRRHRASVVSIALVSIALIAGTAVATWQAFRARNAEEAARIDQQNAERSAMLEARAKVEAQNLAAANAQLAADENQAKLLAQSANLEKDRQLSRAAASLFNAQMTRANLFREAEPVRALTMLYDLDACPLDRRDEAWRLSTQIAFRRYRASIGLQAELVELSPNGKLLAVGRNERRLGPGGGSLVGHVVLYDLVADSVVRSFPEFEVGISQFAFSPDSKRIAVAEGSKLRRMPGLAGQPGSVRILSIESGESLMRLEGHQDTVLTVVFSHDGKHVATGSQDKTAIVWDSETSDKVLTIDGHDEPVPAVAFSPDGLRIATGSLDNTIQIRSIQEGELLTTLRATENSDPLFKSYYEAFKGKAGIGSPGSYNLTITNGVISLDYSPDGKLLAAGNANWQLEFWDTQSHRLVSRIRGEQAPVHSVEFRPNGQSVIAQIGSTLSQWDVETAEKLLDLPSVGDVTLSGDGRFAAFANYASRKVDVLELDAPIEQRLLQVTPVRGGANRVVISSDNRIAAIAGGRNIYLWDLQTGEELSTLTGHQNSVSGLSFSPDGRTLASSSQPDEDLSGQEANGDAVRLWNVETGALLGEIAVAEKHVPAVAISPDGQTVVTLSFTEIAKDGSRFARVSLWYRNSRQLINHLADVPVSFSLGRQAGLEFSRDGTLLACGAGREVLIWDWTSRKLQQTLTASGSMIEIGDI